jgi:adenylosuccinate synthase
MSHPRQQGLERGGRAGPAGASSTNAIVLGAQWGDEGKGKVVDRLSAAAAVVVRFQGGANAGHTIHQGDLRVVLHQLPSGILSPGTLNVVGNGCVVDPVLLSQEMDEVEALGVQVLPERLRLSPRAHVVTPLHRFVDGQAGRRIGTTGRGIGPAYSDKAQRVGLRLEDLLNPSWREAFAARVEEARARHPEIAAERWPGREALIAPLEQAARRLAPFISDARDAVAEAARREDQPLLFEGAQGTMLDLDNGTYPFVTSSSTTIGGAYAGSGVFVDFDTRLAVVKAYTTRVGNGPFPTELDNEIGARLRDTGREYGATTGRPRRCGWLDLVLLDEATRANGFTGLALTKLDCLSGLPLLKVAVDRTAAGQPAYHELEGWGEDIRGATTPDELPRACRAYVAFIEERLGVPVDLLSIGPDRDETLVMRAPW